MRPTQEQLAAHVDDGMSESQIGRLYGVNRNTVHTWKRYCPKRIAGPPRPTADLVAVGCTLGLSERDMAKMFGVTRNTIYDIRKRMGIPAAGKPQHQLAGRTWRNGKGQGKAQRPDEQWGMVRLLEDETVWAGLLAGARYHDAVATDGGAIRLLPSASLTAHSSLAWAG